MNSKIAISLPTSTLDAIERIRKASGKSRSAVIVEAIEFWLRVGKMEAADRDYVRGYLEHPEGSQHVGNLARRVAASWEAWE